MRPGLVAAFLPARWPFFRGLAGWRPSDLGSDLAAGITLAAIAVPEQMATARLGGFAPTAGLIVFIAGTFGFAMFGSSRVLSSGADSTITPIFAGSLALLAASGSPHYFGLASLLALMTGTILLGGGIFRLGWIANLLSIPVMTGFLAGIAIHIVISQLPALLGLAESGSLPHRLAELAAELDHTNIFSLALGLGVFAITLIAERVSSRIPGALIAIAGATAIALGFGFESHGVAAIGAVSPQLPRLTIDYLNINDAIRLLPLALIIAIVAMVQTSATSRAFVRDDNVPDVNGDFIGIGAGNVLSGLFGGFAVNASPPRSGAVLETGGRSQLAGLLAAAAVAALLLFGTKLLAHIPVAALAGILFFVAVRIVRVQVLVQTWTQAQGEFLLIIATTASIALLPIQTGVGVGIALSLLHGIWTMTRARPIELERIPGTTVWWPENARIKGEKLEGVMVLAFQAPLAFINANIFERDIIGAIDGGRALKLVVLEASSIVEVDFTAAQSIARILRYCRARDINFAIARLESTRALAAFDRLGLLNLLGESCVFHSVQDAVRTFCRPIGS
ncbi:MAG: SulP family inorganic anion transporter [Rhizomicrobium sp.]